MKRKHSFDFGYLVFGPLVIGLVQFWISFRDLAHLSYSDAVRLTNEG